MNLPSPFTLDKKSVNIIIETPSGNRNKFEYDPKTEMFKLGKVLPGGADFPMEMGFIPGTKGGDGDPLDAMIMMDQPGYPGCLVECRVIGIISALQQEGKKVPQKNDRIIAVPAAARDFQNIRTLGDVPAEIDDLIHFFKNYNKAEGRKFTVSAIRGPRAAIKHIQKNRA